MDPHPLRLAFAPMATVSHAGFRRLVEDWGGCDLHFSEMVDAGTHLAGRRFEEHYADASPCPDRVVFQVVGADPDLVVAAGASLARRPCRGIDVNMGCSAPHIWRQGAGVAWMNDPDAAGRLIGRLRAAVDPGQTVSAKLRLGEVEDPEALVRFGRALEAAGADFLTLHPRVRRDSLSRPARWSFVEVLRSAVRIPVWGNGDLVRYSDLEARRQRTPADGYMVGRRACAAPWTFRFWKGRAVDPHYDFEVDLEALVHRFHELLEAHQPVEFWVTRARRFYAYYFPLLPFGRAWGARLQGLRDYAELKAEALAWWQRYPEGRLRRASDLE